MMVERNQKGYRRWLHTSGFLQWLQGTQGVPGHISVLRENRNNPQSFRPVFSKPNVDGLVDAARWRRWKNSATQKRGRLAPAAGPRSRREAAGPNRSAGVARPPRSLLRNQTLPPGQWRGA